MKIELSLSDYLLIFSDLVIKLTLSQENHVFKMVIHCHLSLFYDSEFPL